MWHKVAPRLAQRHTVVCADLRGYGDSSKPQGDPGHMNYSKRAMAADQVEVMRSLGFSRFSLVGHDRGGRVAHRLALDHADCVERLAVLDISPTSTMFAKTDQAFATAYYHWFFLIQPFDLPERLIGYDPVYYLRRKIGAASGVPPHFDPVALAAYERCFSDPATIHASCEDYRAAASIDLEHDRADAQIKVRCPMLVLWGEKGVVHRLFDPITDWRKVADDVSGRVLPCGHYLAEEAPDLTLAQLNAFLHL
jgi:haloacetate dehalogenase